MTNVGTVARYTAFTAFLVSLTSPIQSQTLQGTVKDGSSGNPIADASVVLMDDNGRIQRGTLTEPDGSYQLQLPDDESYTLRVGAAGYRVQDTPPFRVSQGESSRVDVLLMSDQQESDLPAGFVQRMELGEGMFLTEEQIQQRTGDLFTDVFSFAPIVRVVALPASTRMTNETSVHGNPTRFGRRSEAFIGGSQQALTLRIKAGQGVAGAVQEGEPARDCVPILWVDGIWWGSLDEASDYGPNGAIHPGDVQGIEVYNHPSILPAQFDTGRETLCGVIVVWRKQSNR